MARKPISRVILNTDCGVNTRPILLQMFKNERYEGTYSTIKLGSLYQNNWISGFLFIPKQITSVLSSTLDLFIDKNPYLRVSD